jgi:alpha-tubulin suppressor-like RCC1 family protein
MSDRLIIVAGDNRYGQCLLPGTGIIAEPTTALLDWLPKPRRVVRVVGGDGFTLLLDNGGHLYAVGSNNYGQLGRGHTNGNLHLDSDNRVPRPVTGIGLERITHIAAGSGHCAAVTEGGKLLLWGLNDASQCGTGTVGANVLAATRCDSGALANADVRVVFVACGYCHTVALTSDGGVVVFGNNIHCQLGTGNNDCQPIPTLLACAALSGVHIVGCAASAFFTHLVSEDGRVFAMGVNSFGQIGTGGTELRVNTPTEIDAAHFGGAPVAVVACGDHHVLAITTGGKLYAWGQGKNGANGGFGMRYHDNISTPQPVVGTLAGAWVVRIVAGKSHSCALTEDGRVFTFGRGGGLPAAGARGIKPLMVAIPHLGLASGGGGGGGGGGGSAATAAAAAAAAGGRGGSGGGGRLGLCTGCKATVPCRCRITGRECAVKGLSGGCWASHSAFIVGTPPDEPGFEVRLAFAMQKPAAKKPDPPAVAALAALQQQYEGGGAVAASSSASDYAQGTKRARDNGDNAASSSNGASGAGGDGAAVDQAYNDGKTPLWMAARYGHEAVVGQLLEAGAAVDQADNDGTTPLYIAARHGHDAVVAMLREAGAKEYESLL